MDEEVLDCLDIPVILTHDALIAFWITNRIGIEEEMIERFDKWGMEVVATWKLLKITTQGDPVYDFDNQKHKVPFESLMLAKKKDSMRKFELPENFVFARWRFINFLQKLIFYHKPRSWVLRRKKCFSYRNPIFFTFITIFSIIFCFFFKVKSVKLLKVQLYSTCGGTEG